MNSFKLSVQVGRCDKIVGLIGTTPGALAGTALDVGRCDGKPLLDNIYQESNSL